MTQTAIDFSRTLTQAGIKQASESAERLNAGWNDQAFNYLKVFVNSRKENETFMCEDIREDSSTVVPEPPSKRAWGAVMRRAIAAGLIRRVGIVHVSNAKAHRANANLYVKNLG